LCSFFFSKFCGEKRSQTNKRVKSIGLFSPF
jgi:hypothetical protein